MVQINFAQKQVNAKIVYYGPGMSGKTTNLEVVHQRAPTANRGDLTSISTDGDRTLFFDFMPLDLGTVAGMRTCFQIYTVPGQVYYNSTRKLVLQGVDGVVFVADSSASMVQENLESLKNLEQNLNEYGKSLATLPHIIQFNKRDLPDAMTVDELNKLLNAHGAPCFEAVANTGQGVFPTLKALAARVLETIHTGARPGVPTMTAAPLPAPAAAPTPAPAPAASGTGYGARPLHQTGYTPVAPAAAAHAPGQNSAPPRQAIPVGAQATSPQPQIPMQRGTIHSGTDSIPRSSVHAPTAPAGPSGQAPAPIPMQSIPLAPGAGPQITRGHPTPAPMGAPMPAPMPVAGPGAAPNLMMQRHQEAPVAPAAAPRPAPTAPMRPPNRPAAPRPVQPRPIAPKIATVTKPKKKSLTTVMLVVAALIAGAVMAVAVLS
jgi:signal recognition particle receptor subunit beta